MKVVMPTALPDVLSWRERRGLNKWDEMWDGVLHMPPMPNYDHQDLEGDLQTFLNVRWAKPIRAKVLHQMNLASIGGWPDDYRIPDLVLLMRSRLHINRGEYLEGAPDVVIEIESPGDETRQKFSFFAKLGAPEIWVIDRDTKEPEVYLLRSGRYRKQRPVSGGWVRSPATGLEMRRTAGDKLAIRIVGDDATRQELPED
jgi:Uma2 family endonuclease